MKKIILLIFIILLMFAANAFGDLVVGGHEAVFDEERGEIYFTGSAMYLWSAYENKEFKDKDNAIFKYNLNDKSMKAFYQGDSYVWALSISYDNKYISILNKPKDAPQTLVLINHKGEKVLALSEHIQEYAWHPDSKKIICMTGTERMHGDNTIIDSNGIWLYNIEENKKEKIVEKGWHLRSDNAERAFYFWNGEKTIKYDLDTRKTQETDILESEEYSSDGRYYVFYLDDPNFNSPYWSPFRIYDTKMKEILPPERMDFISERNPTAYLWGKDSGVLIFKGRRERTIYTKTAFIYDIESNKLIKQLEGMPVGISKDRTVLVMYKDGEFFTEKIPSSNGQENQLSDTNQIEKR